MDDHHFSYITKFPKKKKTPKYFGNLVKKLDEIFLGIWWKFSPKKSRE
jgi:hypothetical protein